MLFSLLNNYKKVIEIRNNTNDKNWNKMSLTILLWEKTYFESFKNFEYFFAVLDKSNNTIDSKTLRLSLI